MPSDKSITHRAIMLASVAMGESSLETSAMGEDNRATLMAMKALGADVREEAGRHRIVGRGLHGLSEPSGPVDCGNSGTTMRLLAGLLAAQRFKTVLLGDASLSSRPMARIVNPLRQRGARIEGRLLTDRIGEVTAPLEVGPLPAPHELAGFTIELRIASAQVKSALLLSGLYAAGPTVVSEPLISRDHTERMMSALGVPLRSVGSTVMLDGPAFSGELPGFALEVPGDLSAAAFVLAAGAMVVGSRVTVRQCGLNPTRSGFIDALRMMGAEIGHQPLGEQLGEPVAHLELTQSPLSALSLGGELLLRSIDEVPVLSAVAARAHGVTEISDAGELRVKESDRLHAMCEVLRAFGVECEERPEGLSIEGRPDRPLRAADIDAHGDHRIAMSAVLLGLCADGETRVRDVAAIATSFPRFVGTMRALGATIAVV